MTSKGTKLTEDNNIIDFNKTKNAMIKTDTTGSDSNNWLSGLKDGTIFLCRPKSHISQMVNPTQQPFLGIYGKSRQTEKAVCLFDGLNPDNLYWCDPIRFCNSFELHEIIYNEEQDNG